MPLAAAGLSVPEQSEHADHIDQPGTPRRTDRSDNHRGEGDAIRLQRLGDH